MNIIRIHDLDFEKGGGLIPVVVQEASSKEVLTLAYVNMEALELTISTGLAHYYRRSHERVMMKGITSGNIQQIVDILVDCDSDALVYIVNQKGKACHVGKRSCFHSRIVHQLDSTQ